MINIEKELIKKLLPTRKENSNKGDFGKVLCITGSNQYIGAGILSAISVLKAGAGYSILCSEKTAIEHYKNYSPDLIYTSHNDFNFDIAKTIIEMQKIDTIVFGCGIGNNNTTLNFTENLINYLINKNIKTVIDADGLNCLAKLNCIVLNENFILTPHPKELSRLLNTNVKEVLSNREMYVKMACEKYKAILILKGHNSIIANNETIYTNTTGNTALAKAGTGDVLAGLIGGFLAQKVQPINAAILSGYIHGLASEIYSKEYNEYSMLASDLLDFIPLALNEVLSQH